jgi:hypothetical protein
VARELAYGIDVSNEDATDFVGSIRFGCSSGLLFLAALSGAGCSQNANLGSIGDGPASLLWKATFEGGSFSEWTSDGHGGPYVENAGNLEPYLTQMTTHRGSSFAAVVTAVPTSMTSIMYLSRDQPTPQAAYYSAWFYVPSSISVPAGYYLSLCHFRSRDQDATDSLTGYWDVNLSPQVGGGLAAQIYDFKNMVNTPQLFTVLFPQDQWVQLEVYFVKATDQTGQLTVWQQGVQILSRLAVKTLRTDYLQWEVGAASNGISPPAASVFVDDAAISLVRLGPDAVF